MFELLAFAAFRLCVRMQAAATLREPQTSASLRPPLAFLLPRFFAAARAAREHSGESRLQNDSMLVFVVVSVGCGSTRLKLIERRLVNWASERRVAPSDVGRSCCARARVLISVMHELHTSAAASAPFLRTASGAAAESRMCLDDAEKTMRLKSAPSDCSRRRSLRAAARRLQTCERWHRATSSSASVSQPRCLRK